MLVEKYIFVYFHNKQTLSKPGATLQTPLGLINGSHPEKIAAARWQENLWKHLDKYDDVNLPS